MILQTEKFKNICSIISTATESENIADKFVGTLELVAENKILYLNVTNREYYISVKFDLDTEEKFHATVEANLFLKLINAITTSELELTVTNNYMLIKANGTYKIPLIYINEELMKLPKIEINNKTVKMNIDGDKLYSILQYNSKELAKTNISQPIQKFYYLDSMGCVTFTSGACVNSFVLEDQIKVLLNQKVVKLFKLFANEDVDFTLGYDEENNIILTKIRLETKNISLTAITPSTDELLNQIPVEVIRNTAFKEYPNKAVLNTESFLEAINRLMLFNSRTTLPYAEFTCSSRDITIKLEDNIETLTIENGSNISEDYKFLCNLNSLKPILSTCEEQYLTMNYGDSSAICLVRQNIRNVVPEAMIA